MKTKVICICLFSLFSFLVFGDELKKVQEDSDTGTYFNLHNKTLITHLLTDSSDEYGDLKSEKRNRVRHVPVSFLKPLGLKENDRIQFYSFNENVVHEYVLGKKVFIVLLKTESSLSMNNWGTFNLILSNDSKEHKRLASISEFNPPRVEGLAYSGGTAKFVAGKYSKLNFEKVSAKNPERKLFGIPKNDIRAVKIENWDLYLDFTENTPILSVKKDKYLLGPLTLSVGEGKMIMANYGDFINGSKVLISSIYPEMKCFKLYLLGATAVTSKNIHCIPENWASGP